MARPPSVAGPADSSQQTPRWRIGDSNSRSPRRRDNRRDLSQLSAAAAFSAVAGLNAGCPSALFEEAAALYPLRTQRPDQNCKSGSQSLGDCLSTSRQVSLLRLNFILRASSRRGSSN